MRVVASPSRWKAGKLEYRKSGTEGKKQAAAEGLDGYPYHCLLFRTRRVKIMHCPLNTCIAFNIYTLCCPMFAAPPFPVGDVPTFDGDSARRFSDLRRNCLLAFSSSSSFFSSAQLQLHRRRLSQLLAVCHSQHRSLRQTGQLGDTDGRTDAADASCTAQRILSASEQRTPASLSSSPIPSSTSQILAAFFPDPVSPNLRFC